MTNSMANLSTDGEFRYIIQWFHEWSELQRDDFVPVLVEYLLQPTDAVYMNGVVNNMSHADINAKPMSLFQCRIKLFRQWCPKWPQDFKIKLKEKIIEIDPKVGEKISYEMKEENGTAAVVVNGTAASTHTTNENEDCDMLLLNIDEPHVEVVPSNDGNDEQFIEIVNAINDAGTHAELEPLNDVDIAAVVAANENNNAEVSA